MIRFSFSSLYMSLLFANIMILFLYLAFRSQKLLLKFGLPMAGSVLLAAIVRMLVPFELLNLSHNIYLPKPVSMAIGEFLHPQFFGDRFSYWSFAKMIWLAGILIFAVRTVKRERTTARAIAYESRKLPKSASASRVFRRIQKEIPRTCRIELRTLPMIHVPMIYGLRHPYILLPENFDLDETNLYYILRHESAHYLHHDLLLKVLIQLFCIIYWWNPLCIPLQKQTDIVLEMRADHEVAKNPSQKMEYALCLETVMKYLLKSVSASPPAPVSSISFCQKSHSATIQRVRILLKSETPPHKGFQYILVSFMATLFVLSFVYIFEASSIPYDIEKETDSIDASNAFFIERGDGTYEFYLDNEYCGIIDSLQYFDKDIPIYKEGSEV